VKFILGTKEYMTQIFDEKGRVHAGTVISAGPLTVVQVKGKDNEGYESVQVGLGIQKESRLSKAVVGHSKDAGLFKHLREFRLDEPGTLAKGDKIAVDTFVPGDVVEVRGTSKGKGFQGVVKRHGFSGGPRSHGQSHSEREPGSIGGGLRTRVPKGMRMGGRTGSDTIFVKNLKVLHIDPEQNLIVISGAVPGRRGSIVEIISR
jgi:large subunit ribosomal protein L3